MRTWERKVFVHLGVEDSGNLHRREDPYTESQEFIRRRCQGKALQLKHMERLNGPTELGTFKQLRHQVCGGECQGLSKKGTQGNS